MTADHSDTKANAESEENNTSRLNRRLILSALGTVTGLSALTNSASALEDGKVLTRGCHDDDLTAQDWSTGAVTIQACPNGHGGTATVKVTGKLGFERYTQPRRQPRGGGGDQSPTAEQRQRVVVKQGQTVNSEEGTTANQSQTVIVKQQQTVVDDGDGEGHLPEVELTLRPGERQTVWYTGTIAGYEMSNNNLNVGMANRFD